MTREERIRWLMVGMYRARGSVAGIVAAYDEGQGGT